MGFQEAPTSVVFHTPPATPPKYQVSGSPGTPLTATTRPPRNGPIWRHFMPPRSAGLMSGKAALHNHGISRSATKMATDGANRCVIFYSRKTARGRVSYSKAKCRLLAGRQFGRRSFYLFSARRRWIRVGYNRHQG